jgi:signal peptidase I
MRENAANWLELADKVYHYRRDVLPAPLAELQAQSASCAGCSRNEPRPMKLKLGDRGARNRAAAHRWHALPEVSLVENVEFFLVAAIVILGFRTYFVQPFKIPTNSMWPTYHGMTADNHPPGEVAPGIVARTFRLAAFGAQRREVTAPKTGVLSADFLQDGRMAFTVKRGRNWLVLPAQVREYTFYVDGEPATVTVPLDFHDFDRVVTETFFTDRKGFAAHLQKLEQSGVQPQRAVIAVNSQATAPGFSHSAGPPGRGWRTGAAL